MKALVVAEARAVDTIPQGPDWIYEPKWDGFRCLLSRLDDDVRLRSKAGEDLTRYFPDLVTAARMLKSKRWMLDGEIVVPRGDSFSFDELLQRIHPAQSRVRKLATERPVLYIAFDLLDDGKKLFREQPFAARRAKLETFAARHFVDLKTFRLSKTTIGIAQARRWLKKAGGGCDGIVAKRLDLPYQSGGRDGMQKVKRYRSADCVVGGLRFNEESLNGEKVVGSLLLGLYDEAGLLHHVGFTSGLKTAEKSALTAKLMPLAADTSFTGKTPGGPSRWSTRRSSIWQPLKPELVVEVSYDHASGQRFRHGTSIMRWRPDKRPGQCRMDQLAQSALDVRRLLSAAR